MNDKLGDYIREQRENNETYRSLRQFAAALNKSPSWVSKVERNEEKPGNETLALIAKLLDADVARLFELADRLEPDVEKGLTGRYGELSGLLRKIKDMPSEKIEELEMQVKSYLSKASDDGEAKI